MTRGIIVAVSPEGVIGLDGRIPWHYSGDLKRFKRVTLGSTIVMGRLTWESIGSKPLPKRRNMVITSRQLANVEFFHSIPAAIAASTGPVWFIGGARIYEEAMHHCDLLDITYVPDHIDNPAAVRFPEISETLWEAGPLEPHDRESSLKHRIYRRRRK